MRIRRRIVWGLLVFVLLGLVGTVGGCYAAGYRAYVVHTGSMVPNLVPGDLIIDGPASGDYRPGQVITFRHGPTADVVTHRITQVTAAGIHTKGDANPTADVWTIPDNYVEGSVDWRVHDLGYLVVFLRQPTGFAAIVVIIIGLILLWQLFFPAEDAVAATEPTEQEDQPTALVAAITTDATPAPERARPRPGRHRTPDDTLLPADTGVLVT